MSLEVKPVPQHKLGGAYDAGRANQTPRERQAVDADGYPIINERTGEPRLERVRRRPSAKYVSKSGHVVYIATTWGSGEKRDPAHEAHVREMMHRRQGVRYSTCPIRDDLSRQWLPREMRNAKPCAAEDFGPGRKYGAHCGCPHIEQLIEYRSADHKKREEIQKRKFVPEDVKVEERQDRLVEKMVTLLASARGGDGG